MFDVFNEEIELLIKEGIANLYWYKSYLHKCWIRAGVPNDLKIYISKQVDCNGKSLSKRQQMDLLYDKIRLFDYNRRLEISRNFFRTLSERKDFIPDCPEHKIYISERAALKLREIARAQNLEKEKKELERIQAQKITRYNYNYEMAEEESKMILKKYMSFHLNKEDML